MRKPRKVPKPRKPRFTLKDIAELGADTQAHLLSFYQLLQQVNSTTLDLASEGRHRTNAERLPDVEVAEVAEPVPVPDEHNPDFLRGYRRRVRELDVGGVAHAGSIIRAMVEALRPGCGLQERMDAIRVGEELLKVLGL